MAVVGDCQEGSCPAPRAPVQCYSLVSVPLPSVLIGVRTPDLGVLPVKGRCAFCCHGCCAILRFCVFGRNQDGVVLAVIGGNCVGGLCKRWCE